MTISNDHFFLTSASDIQGCMSPLSALGINYFSWDRHYNDGSRINLCSMAEDLENYYSNKLYVSGNTEAYPSSYQSQVVLWSTLPNQKVFEFIKQRGINNGIFLIDQHKDYCEFTSFAVKKETVDSVNLFLTHMEFLNKFKNYFKDHAKNIIKKGELNKIYIPYHQKPLPKINEYDQIPAFDIKSNLKLSPRQHSCAKLILAGKTANEIAESLSLSTRTIESYINNLKIKLNCANRADLIVKLIKILGL